MFVEKLKATMQAFFFLQHSKNCIVDLLLARITLLATVGPDSVMGILRMCTFNFLTIFFKMHRLYNNTRTGLHSVLCIGQRVCISNVLTLVANYEVVLLLNCHASILCCCLAQNVQQRFAST